MSDYFDKDGRPLGMMEWAKLNGDREYRTIGRQRKADVSVSTVWLGLNHNFGPDGPPLIFETMIFGGDYDQEQYRWATLEEAVHGHRVACDLAFGAFTGGVS